MRHIYKSVIQVVRLICLAETWEFLQESFESLNWIGIDFPMSFLLLQQEEVHDQQILLTVASWEIGGVKGQIYVGFLHSFRNSCVKINRFASLK